MMARLAVTKEQPARRRIVDRRHHGDVGQMGTAAVGIVRDKHVARGKSRVVRQNPLDGLAHRPQVNGDVRRIDDQIAGG